MNIDRIQKEYVYWFDGSRLDLGNFGKTLLIGVQGETPIVTPDEENEKDHSISLQLCESERASTFIAKPSKPFSSSAMFKRMLAEIAEKECNEQKNLQAKSLLKLDEMLNCVTLLKIAGNDSIQCQLSFNQTSKNTLLVLQRLLAFCLVTISSSETFNETTQQLETDVGSLRLYSFAWFCSLLRTLGFYPYCTRMEHLFMHNLKRIFKAKNCKRMCKVTEVSDSAKDFYYVLMFLCSIAVRRAEPIDSLLKYLYENKYISTFRRLYTLIETQQTTVAQRLTLSNTALQITEALENYFKDKVSKKRIKSETSSVLIMVEVFLSWIVRIVSKTTATQRVAMLRSIVCFDTLVCEIACDSDTAYRRYVVTRHENQQTRSCRMSYSDLCEWLRYMVLLQLDERNIHSKTEFYIYASPKLYDFGPPPHLTFENDGIDYLTFFLLESEFIRSSLHQKRPEIRRLREKMMHDVKLLPFINTREPFNNYVVLCRELLDVTLSFYDLKTIQAVPLTTLYSN